jgi:hypothetical protein
VLPEDHPLTLTALCNSANLLSQRGEHDGQQRLDIVLGQKQMGRPNRPQPDIEQRIAIGRHRLADVHGSSMSARAPVFH